MIAPLNDDSQIREVLNSCVDALRNLAEYQLEPAINQRMFELGERKEFLTPAERDELTALVEFWERRLIEQLQAQVVLKQVAELFPDLVDSETR